jgi:hypothetical protein
MNLEKKSDLSEELYVEKKYIKFGIIVLKCYPFKTTPAPFTTRCT